MGIDYPYDWDERRKKVYDRDNYTCQNCGAQGGGQYGNAELHAHHIVPKSKGGTHEVSNLKTICNECHSAIHNENVHAPTHPGIQTQNNESVEHQFPIVSDEYSEEVQAEIDRANLLYKIYMEWGKAEDAYSRLEELFEIAFSTRGSSDRLNREADEVYERIVNHFDEIERLNNELIESAGENIDSREEKLLTSHKESLSQYLPLVRENLDVAYEALTEEDGEILNTTEYAFLKEDIEAAREKYHDATESYMEFLWERLEDDQEPGKEKAVNAILAIGWFIAYVWLGSSIEPLLPENMHVILVLIIYPVHLFLAFGVPYVIYKDGVKFLYSG